VRTGRPAPSWTEGALAALARYRWPGNVRELANIVERLAILHSGADVTAESVRAVLPVERGTTESASPWSGNGATTELPLSDALDAYERRLITSALDSSDGNIAEAARRLRTDRPNLYRRMRRLGIAHADA
jgi:two-component system nitrogen regulation response regulator NtrX